MGTDTGGLRYTGTSDLNVRIEAISERESKHNFFLLLFSYTFLAFIHESCWLSYKMIFCKYTLWGFSKLPLKGIFDWT
jgi:hypothetical protein